MIRRVPPNEYSVGAFIKFLPTRYVVVKIIKITPFSMTVIVDGERTSWNLGDEKGLYEIDPKVMEGANLRSYARALIQARQSNS